ncbi:swr complex subunit [Lignoscripta atroalba]|nr:swr complex subunit [Lignoscripta atroalba]
MATADVRDILDVKRETPRPIKKQKTTQRRPDHISRELFELVGDRAPPIVISEPQYKERPKWSRKVQPWELKPFTNPARKDGLILKHWRKKGDVNGEDMTAPVTSAELDGAIELTQESKPTQTEPDYHFAKFNVKVTGPEYSEEQYAAHLKSDDWSKDETDYLVNLALDFDLRWILIADRYDYQPTEVPPEGDSMTVAVPPKSRSMEDMKARYYDVAAKMMALHHPMASMSTTEFDLHEKMTKFRPEQETTRKRLAEALMSRSPEDIREEEVLLGELKRIVTNEERFAQERKELYARLEAPQSTGSTGNDRSSQGLAQLLQTLMNADKSKKRRSLMGPGDSTTSPAGGSGHNSATQGDRGQRDSIGGSSMKKGSVSGNSNQRQLTPREEAKYGVTHHERLSSGVQFRQEKINKLTQAKSNVQSTKLSAALTELQIPARSVMPTVKVANEYERLVQSIMILLDVRKVSEKTEGEIRVIQAQKEERERRESGEAPRTPENPSSSPAEDDGEVEAEAEADVDEPPKQEDEDGDGDPDVPDEGDVSRASVAPSVRSSAGHKRSVSVMSGVSEKSTKRQRK